MKRTFQSWWTSLPKGVKEKFCWNEGDKPHLNQGNYVWVTNMIEGNSKNLNPTVEEILDCVITDQIDARRK